MDKDQHAGVSFASQDKDIQNALNACSFKELCEAERSSGAEVASILFPILGWNSGGIGAAADEVSKLLSAARGEAAFHAERSLYWEKVAKDRCGEAVERDAARYRWLNKQHNFMVYVEDEKQTRTNLRLRCGLPLDEWIDLRIEDDRLSRSEENK